MPFFDFFEDTYFVLPDDVDTMDVGTQDGDEENPDAEDDVNITLDETTHEFGIDGDFELDEADKDEFVFVSQSPKAGNGSAMGTAPQHGPLMTDFVSSASSSASASATG